jgi:hypothetical protein
MGGYGKQIERITAWGTSAPIRPRRGGGTAQGREAVQVRGDHPYVRFPAPLEVEGTVNPDEPRPACGGIGMSIFRRIKFKRPVDGLLLYDGSFSPPRRLWP